MANTKQLVREQAISLPEGCSTRGTCPECKASGTFSMTRTHSEVAYICFRAGCTCRGIISSKGSDGDSLEQKGIRQKKLFNGTLSALEEWEMRWLSSKFLIDESWLKSVRYSEDDKRVYYPQFDMMGRVHGYIARHYDELADGARLKGAKAYWKAVLPTDIGLCFPNMDVLQQVVDTKRVCVVEDYPSMLRINSQIGIPTCCLGGTNIYEAHINGMLALDVKELIILLDADAVTKAVKLKRSLALAFDNVRVIPLLGADPKDMTEHELNLIFEGI